MYSPLPRRVSLQTCCFPVTDRLHRRRPAPACRRRIVRLLSSAVRSANAAALPPTSATLSIGAPFQHLSINARVRSGERIASGEIGEALLKLLIASPLHKMTCSPIAMLRRPRKDQSVRRQSPDSGHTTTCSPLSKTCSSFMRNDSEEATSKSTSKSIFNARATSAFSIGSSQVRNS